jgi:2-dehydropantoate 2-reductase
MIVGAGAVGLGIASAIALGGKDVTVVTRRQSVCAELRNRGISCRGVLGERYVPPESFVVAERIDKHSVAEADHVIVCVKAFDTCNIARDLVSCRSELKSAADITLCQNGWGAHEALCEIMPLSRIFHASIMTGFERFLPTEVNIAVHARPIRIGNLILAGSAAVKHICDALSAGGLPATASDDIARDMWDKMLFNCSLNPLSAIFGVAIGRLVESESGRMAIEDVVCEIFDVMAAAGFHSRFASAAEYLRHLHAELIPLTASHRSSMLQDIDAGHRTEIDALNGAVVRLGGATGVDAIYNRFVCELIRTKESLPVRPAPMVA